MGAFGPNISTHPCPGLDRALGDVAQIDGDHVHRDGAEQRRPVSGDRDVEPPAGPVERAGDAVRVPREHDPDPPCGAAGRNASIAHALTGFHRPDLPDPRFERRHRPHPRRGARVVGIVAEQRDTGAYQVEMVFRPEKGARGIREAGARGRKGAAECAEPTELAAVGRRSRLVRA